VPLVAAEGAQLLPGMATGFLGASIRQRALAGPNLRAITIGAVSGRGGVLGVIVFVFRQQT
jgi:hypothetical protein